MELLPRAQLAMNIRLNPEISGMSPFYLRNGYDLNALAEPTNKENCKHPGKIRALEYVQTHRDAQDFAQVAMASAQQGYEKNANRLRRQPERFKVGDKV